MGAEPYVYFVPYEKDIGNALEKLRQQEFAAGRYRGAPLEDLDGETPDAQSAKHRSIEDAVAEAAEEGTASILDVGGISEELDYGHAGPLEPENLQDFFGTDVPTREQVEHGLSELFENLERGLCVYVIIYRDESPSELLFAGYSYD
jgi:hypothetical protein